MTWGVHAYGEVAWGDDPSIASLGVAAAYADALARPDVEVVVVVKLSAVLRSDPETAVTWWLSSKTWATAPTDSPASQPMLGVIEGLRNFRQMGLAGAGQGPMVTGRIAAGGELELDNSEGQLDDLLDAQVVDGRQVQVWAAGWDRTGAYPAWSEYGLVYVGTAGQWRHAGTSVVLALDSLNRRLRKGIGTRFYYGAGLQSGDPDLAELSRQQVYGLCYNIPVTIVTEADLICQVHDDAVGDILAVYDKAVELQKGGNRSTYNGIREAEPNEGTYATSLQTGYLKLGDQPVGRLTADVDGDKAANRELSSEAWSDGTLWSDGTGWTSLFSRLPVRSTAQAIWRILEDRAEFGPSEINEGAFFRLDKAQPGLIGYFVPAGDGGSIEDHIAAIAAAAGACVGPDRYNRTTIVRLQAPSDNAAVVLDTRNIPEGGVERLTAPWGTPPYQYRINYRRNWTVMDPSELEDTVGQTRRRHLSRPSLASIGSDDTIRDLFPSAPARTIDSYFNELSDAQAERARLLATFTAQAILVSVKAKGVLGRCDIGQTVHLTWDRHGLDAGRFMVVVAVEDDLLGQLTTLTLFG